MLEERKQINKKKEKETITFSDKNEHTSRMKSIQEHVSHCKNRNEKNKKNEKDTKKETIRDSYPLSFPLFVHPASPLHVYVSATGQVRGRWHLFTSALQWLPSVESSVKELELKCESLRRKKSATMAEAFLDLVKRIMERERVPQWRYTCCSEMKSNIGMI